MVDDTQIVIAVPEFREFSGENSGNFGKCKCNKLSDDYQWRTSVAATFKQLLLAISQLSSQPLTVSLSVSLSLTHITTYTIYITCLVTAVPDAPGFYHSLLGPWPISTALPSLSGVACRSPRTWPGTRGSWESEWSRTVDRKAGRATLY